MQKNIIIGVILIVALSFAGYFAYYNFVKNRFVYELVLQSEMNSADFDAPKGQAEQTREAYRLDGIGDFTVNILQYGGDSAVEAGISRLKKENNPTMIILEKKYVNYYVLPSSEKYHRYFYRSGKNIVTVDFVGNKDDADAFIIWYYSKYPNQ